MKGRPLNALTTADLNRLAPSIFATQPIDGVTDRYSFLPTISAVETMAGMGFLPVRASQSTSRTPDRRVFCRHMLRFRHVDHLDADLHEEVAEIVLSNSHDRSAAYSLSAGIFRTVCSNGLTIQSSDFGSFSIRHKGKDTRKAIEDATHEIVSHMPRVFETVSQWKQIILPRWRQIEMAREAWALKPCESIKPVALLTARRPADYTDEDASRDLWRTLNVCEENLIRGGLVARNSRGRQIRTRPIKSVSADLSIHRRLWEIAQSYSLN